MEINNRLSEFFLGGKSLEDLNFPENWKYNSVLCVWYSEQYVLRDVKTGKKKDYLYLTDELLFKLGKNK
jgi:hypothetical protein